MSLPFRITFEDKDYTYTILSKKIDKDTSEIKISFDGEELTITRNSSGEWDVLERTISDGPDLKKSIARNVALRYRLK
ncbi:hypothetical protein [Sphingobacterium hungaricum]|uniref:Uncharacterized protein n=1 Tax=Sphingobacterium hungaricum TaxID=2082723 RepID=A0A928UWQ6_9SPHI|nr:hypothetical protein [Sphingobacterium hungaricum]MBE8712715.1 hypothetical protein [Sphingobacterium hungaricum]